MVQGANAWVLVFQQRFGTLEPVATLAVFFVSVVIAGTEEIFEVSNWILVGMRGADSVVKVSSELMTTVESVELKARETGPFEIERAMLWLELNDGIELEPSPKQPVPYPGTFVRQKGALA
jgi:hypothetical protein